MQDEVIIKNTKSAMINLKKFNKSSLLAGQQENPVRTKQFLAVEDRCIV